MNLTIHSQSIHFNRFTTDDGLSGPIVVDIIQDRSGFIWLATDDGLNRFDGYEFKVYRNDPEDSTSISGNSTWAIYEDRSGFIWIGTTSGELNRYNPLTDSFKWWDIKSDIVKENSIVAIFEDKFGLIWIGTYKSGLYRLDPRTEIIDHWTAEPNNPNKVAHLYIMEFLEDNNGDLWIGTYLGLNKLIRTNDGIKFEHYFSDKNNSTSITNNTIWNISQSDIDSNQIWIGTAHGITSYRTDTKTFSQIYIPNSENLQFGSSAVDIIDELINGERFLWVKTYDGLAKINLPYLETIRYRHDENNPNSLIDNRINKMIKDRSGVIWLGTENGLCNFSPKSKKFNYSSGEKYNYFDVGELAKKNITVITQTSDGTIWFGTIDGVYHTFINKESISIKKFPLLNGVHIYSMIPGGENELWIGTYGSGLKHLHIKNKTLTDWKFDHYKYKFKTYAIHYIKSLLKISDSNILVGTWGTGLINLSNEIGDFNLWLNEGENLPFSISHNDIWTLYQDKRGRIWVGTEGGGIDLFENSDGGKFYNIFGTENVVGNIDFRNIHCITESNNTELTGNDSKTVLWVGTASGLFKISINNHNDKYIPSKEDFEITNYSMKDGLPDNNIKAILEDENGNLWLSTSSGISLFDTESGFFKNFNDEDGVIGDNFNLASALKTDDGLFLFGSPSGLNYFIPVQIKSSDFTPPVVITDFQLFNEPVPVGENSALKTNITSTKEIELSYDQDVISFKFAALDYNAPKSIHYAYMMEGFDKDWIHSGTRRFVTYTNLNPGSYTFKVKSSNSDGIWSPNEAKLIIIVNNPWWSSGWAYAIYLILVAVGIYSIRRYELNRLQLKNQVKLDEAIILEKEETDKMKSRFFSNISHEFRTPLTLILGPMEILNRNSSSEEIEKQLAVIKRNARRLLGLINQLLDLSKLEAGKMQLKASSNNIVAFVRGIVMSFESVAERKDISLKVNSTREVLEVYFERDMMVKILTNLLSNAFKFTQVGGAITVSVLEKTENSIEIIIRDTGIGISDEELTKLFDRFYQVDSSQTREHEGTGLGLALTKELIELHRGSIKVESNLGEGSTFIITLPLGKSHLNDSEMVIAADFSEESILIDESIFNKNTEPVGDSSLQETSDDKNIILIVEDNKDVREYIKDSLGNNFQFEEAANGEQGLRKATQIIPDLIISDIMMPNMDGNEFTRQLKHDEKTSHIPVILLTAKTEQESKLEGLETGADDYLTKPFDTKELRIRIRNLINNRRKLQEIYSRRDYIPVKRGDNKKFTNLEEEFMSKVLEVIDKHMAEEDFNVEELGGELAMGRVQIYRKLKALTGLSPSKLISIRRLNTARTMILEQKGNISEIAFSVGFGSPAYFTRCFKEKFGYLPSDLVK